MSGYPPPFPPPGSPYGGDWRYQRRVMRDQARLQRDMMRAQRQAYREQMRGMRRGSIVGPLLVIAIGIVVLMVQVGHLNGHRLATWYGHWWPLLFIGIGGVLLAEWMVDRGLNEGEGGHVRRSLGGGVVVLLVLLGLAGIAANSIHEGARAFFAHGLNINQDEMDEFLGDKHESDQSLDQTFPVGDALSVTNPRGDVTISGTSDDGQMHVSVHKEVYTRSDSEAAKKAQELVPQIGVAGGVVSLSLSPMEGARADLTITVPAWAQVTVNANHGDVKLASVKAAVTILANHGDVDVSAVTGSVTAHVNHGGSSFAAHSVTGPVSVEGHANDLTISDIVGPVMMNGEFFGTTHLERVSSAVKFHTSRTDFQVSRLDGTVEISPDADFSADKTAGPLVLNTRNRNINLERVAGDVSVTNRNGSVDVTSAPPMGNVTVENRNGSVEMTVPEQAGFTVQAQTTDGNVEDDFSLASQENDSRKSLSGTVGKGGPLVRINTSQGDISLKKASVQPLPPLPPSPPILIRAPEGDSVSIGKDGLRVSGEDGSLVSIGKDGVRVVAGPNGRQTVTTSDGTVTHSEADGGKVYVSRDGTRLTTGVDGSVAYVGRDGTQYSSRPDGSQTYMGADGTRITVSPDGSKVGIGPGGKTLSDAEIARILAQAQAEVKRVSARRDAELRKH